MNKFIINNSFFGFFLLIIVIASFLRFYQLGSNPPSLNWDEVSLGYNAYSILKTGADEYGNRFPLSIRSFDDYKPPLYVYLSIPFIAVLGLNEFTVRLPSAMLGILSVVVIYFLAKVILTDMERKKKELISLLSAFFLAVSPWHLQFSRAAYEGNIGLFFVMLALLLFFYGIRGRRTFFLLSSISFVMGMYSYHSFRLLVPLVILILFIIFFKDLKQHLLRLSIAGLLFLILGFPIYTNFLTSSEGSSSRLSMVSVFSSENLTKSINRIDYDRNNNVPLGDLFHNRRVVYFFSVIKGYLDHFDPDFLFIHGDGGVQHHAVDFGMLYIWDIPLILLGIHFLIKRRNRFIVALIVFFLLAPLPSAITTGTPHPVRAIAMAPSFHIFAATGFVLLLSKIYNKKVKYLFLASFLLFFILNFSYYLHQYYVHTPIEYGYFWQYGNKEALLEAKKLEDRYEKIIMTYKYDQPYIYYLFYHNVDPKWYQKNWNYKGNGQVDRFKRIIGKYEFRNIDFAKDSSLSKALLIGAPEEIPETAKIIKEILFLDGRIAYKIAET